MGKISDEVLAHLPAVNAADGKLGAAVKCEADGSQPAHKTAVDQI